MNRHLASVGALLLMVVFAFGSVDTTGVNTGTAPTPPANAPVQLDPEIDGQEPQNNEAVNAKTLKMGETVSVGYTSYNVGSARWSRSLSDNQLLDQAPDASYLIIAITVRNDDKKARTIPPFKLIDETGAEYEASSKAFAIKDSIGPLDSLNPGVSKQGSIVFDVPQTHTYQLKVSGGFWSGDSAMIEIDPE